MLSSLEGLVAFCGNQLSPARRRLQTLDCSKSCFKLSMPKHLKGHNTEPLEPHEFTSFHLNDGQSIQLQIFRDIDTNVELVQCDLCGLFFTLTKQRLPTHLKGHRCFMKCQKATERRVRQPFQNEETVTRQVLFCGPQEAVQNSCTPKIHVVITDNHIFSIVQNYN
jgi:hypothetical protein